MSAKVRKTLAAEAVATHLSWDLDEMCESAYQPSDFVNPTIFTAGDDYYCAVKTKRPPKTTDRNGFDCGFVWKPVYEWRGYTVYCSLMKDMND